MLGEAREFGRYRVENFSEETRLLGSLGSFLPLEMSCLSLNLESRPSSSVYILRPNRFDEIIALLHYKHKTLGYKTSRDKVARVSKRGNWKEKA